MSKKKPDKRRSKPQDAPVGPVLRSPWDPEAPQSYEEEPWEDGYDDDGPSPPGLPPGYDPFLTERSNRAIGRIIAHFEVRDFEECNALLQRVSMGKTVDEIVAEARRLSWDDAEEAQFLMFDAMVCDDEDEALALTRKALKLDPANADANAFMAHWEEDTADVIAGLRSAIATAEEVMGPEYMKENRGHFWGMVETRPYMRARQALLEVFIAQDMLAEAIREGEAMLELNPNDNQGVRDWLYGLYLEQGNTRAVRALLKRYRSPGDALWAYAHTLECVMSNNTRAAGLALRKSVRLNPHFLKFLVNPSKIPKTGLPRAYIPGSPEEAMHCMNRLGNAWMKHPRVAKWLVKELTVG